MYLKSSDKLSKTINIIDYCEIIVSPSYWDDVAELARLRSPKNEVQR